MPLPCSNKGADATLSTPTWEEGWCLQQLPPGCFRWDGDGTAARKHPHRDTSASSWQLTKRKIAQKVRPELIQTHLVETG